MKNSQNILVIVGHPAPKSLCRSLAEKYADGARRSGATATLLDLSTLEVDLYADPRLMKNLEPDILRAQRLISEATHLTIAYPVWWGASPAVLKGFVDRTFTTGFAYKYEGGILPTKLLKGRSARILLTMDSPGWWNRMAYRRAAVNWLRWATLWFTGFKVKSPKEFCNVRTAKPDQIERWLVEAESLGFRDAS